MMGELLTLSELTLELIVAVSFAAGVIVGAACWSRPAEGPRRR